MKKTTLFLVLSMMPLTSWGELPKSFVKAIWKVETNCREGNVLGDHGLAKGPLQIHRLCWKDSRVKGSYEQVTNLVYATQVMEAYCTRYESKAVKRNDFEVLSRLWNQGPNWREKKGKSDNYWKRVRSHLPQQKIDNLSCHDTK